MIDNQLLMVEMNTFRRLSHYLTLKLRHAKRDVEDIQII